jgi:hypothetical protein
MSNDSNNQDLELKASEITKTFYQKFQQETLDIYTILQKYNTLQMNYANIFDLYEIIDKQNRLLKKDIAITSGVIVTNNRKSIYENQVIDKLKYWYSWIIFFYILIIIAFVIGLFLLPWETPRRNYIILLILLCVYPFTIPYFIVLEKKIFSWFQLWQENPSLHLSSQKPY